MDPRTMSRAGSPPSRGRALLPCLLFTALAAAGCGEDAAPSPSREPSRAPRTGLEAPEDAEGLGGMRLPTSRPARSRSKLEWALPAGWEEAPADPRHTATFRLSRDHDTVCSLGYRPGLPGGLAAFVSHWRARLGLEPVDAAAVAALPRISVLGEDGVLVDLSGQEEGGEGDRRLLGVVREQGPGLLVLELRGPAATVAEEASRFEAFARSLAHRAGTVTPTPASRPTR